MNNLDKLIESVTRTLLTSEYFGDLDGKGADYTLAAIEHRGDCTKEPFTCSRCYADETRKLARAAILAVHDYLPDGISKQILANSIKAEIE